MRFAFHVNPVHIIVLWLMKTSIRIFCTDGKKYKIIEYFYLMSKEVFDWLVAHYFPNNHPTAEGISKFIFLGKKIFSWLF